MGIIILMLSPFSVQAQFTDPVAFTVTDAPDKVQTGESFEITVEARIDGKWHLYSVDNDPDAGPFPTQFSTTTETVELAGKIKESEPVIEYDPNFDVELGWHTKEATFTIPLSFSKEASGSSDIALEVLYQVCDDKVCLPPKTETISKNITVAGAEGNLPDGSVDASNEPATPSKKQMNSGAQQTDEQITPTTGSFGSEGILSFLWLAIAAGFAALITPCVYPMIPLTVSYFSKNKQSGGLSAGVSALWFGLTIVAVFTLLGVLLSLLLGVSGANQFAANPWVNLFIAIILIVFAFSLLGAFEIQLPHQLTNWLNQKSNNSTGVTGIIFMALTISAISFACTAPFVSGLFAALSQGEWFYPVVGMMGFSAAFASPFVLLALFPTWMESLPKSGSWMNIVKVLLGFIELAAAFKFLSNADLVWEWGLISRTFTIAAWIVFSMLAGLYLLGVFAMQHETKPKTIGTGRLMLSIPFLLLGFYLIPGLLGASLGIWDSWLPPKQATDVSVVYSISQRGGGEASANSTEFENWSDDYQMSVERAAKKNKPVFIDFTGYTCTNCRAMETNVFPLAPVQNKFEQMELVRLYTDDGTDGPANQKFQYQLTGTVALPTYAIVNPFSGKIIAQLVGYSQKEDFNNFLDKGLARFDQQNEALSTVGKFNYP